MKKLLFLAALVGGSYAMVKKRQQAAAAEAALWDEATGATQPPVTSTVTPATAPTAGTEPATS